MPPVLDLTELVSRAAAECPDRMAVVESEGRSLTWQELEEQVARTAAGLEDAGVLAGSRVLFALGNRLEFLSTYLGTLRANAVAVPVNPGSTPGELARMIADCGARVVVADPDSLAVVREAVGASATAADADAADAPQVVVVAAEPEGREWGLDRLLAPEARDVPPRQDPEALAVLLYTSGTSGRPRAAMLSHRALLANLEQVGAVEPPMIHADDIVLGVVPLFHVYGLNAVLGGVLWNRAKLLLVDRFDPEDCLDLIEDEACTVVPVAPAVFEHWLRSEALAERLGPVRLVLSGSAPLRADVIDRFTGKTGLPVHQGYGLTEAAPVVTSTLGSTDPEPGSVGTALPGIELRLVDEQGHPSEGEDPGEIEIRGDNLFSGYWPDGADGPDADGWWRTGDVGILVDDGDLVLVDRVRELVIVSGFNVYPVEVEDVIGEVPGVGEVAVIGVDDDETGEAVVAYVHRAPGTAGTDGEPTDAELAEAVRRHCAERLARFKQPTRVEVVDDLPLTVTGKVQKGRLRGYERRRRLELLRTGGGSGGDGTGDSGGDGR